MTPLHEFCIIIVAQVTATTFIAALLCAAAYRHAVLQHPRNEWAVQFQNAVDNLDTAAREGREWHKGEADNTVGKSPQVPRALRDIHCESPKLRSRLRESRPWWTPGLPGSSFMTPQLGLIVWSWGKSLERAPIKEPAVQVGRSLSFPQALELASGLLPTGLSETTSAVAP